MEPKRKEPGGCPPTDEQKTFSVHLSLIHIFTHDRGYHIHSYNTFFPMWYASALAFYIGDFRYHSRYSHFENTPSGGDFVNETFKIIYQGN